MAVLCHRQLKDPALQPLLFVVQLQPSILRQKLPFPSKEHLPSFHGIGSVFQARLLFPSSQSYMWEAEAEHGGARQTCSHLK